MRYNPVSYHNGSVWPHDTAAAALGMARYGLNREARQVARALFDVARAADDRRLSELLAGFERAGRARTCRCRTPPPAIRRAGTPPFRWRSRICWTR